ncbi:MAG: thymidylate synthase, partial [Gluconobacter japonicus]
KIERIETLPLRFHCRFSVYAQVEAKLPGWRAEKTLCDFDAEGAWLTLAVPVEDADTVTDYLRDLTRGQMTISRLD